MIFYVHHQYSYELFWYFFHGVDIDVKTIPTWFYENRHNKHKKYDLDVSIDFKYKDVSHTVTFVNDRDWNKIDGYHILDYTISLIQNNIIADKGWNSTLDKKLSDYVLFLNNNTPNNGKSIFFYIIWEPLSTNQIHHLTQLSNNVTVYTDHFSTKILKNKKNSLTHILSSYIFPDTISLKNYYFFGKFLKEYDGYQCKLNFPIRKVEDWKKKVFDSIQTLNNDDIRCSISSFTDYKQHEGNVDLNNLPKKFKINDEIKNGNNIYYVQKRGYNLNDWGGEWNDTNMKEYMWKLLTYSEVNIVFENTPLNHVNEKSISHILAGKPFIPAKMSTVKYYENHFKEYGLDCKPFPFEYKYIFDILPELDRITQNEQEWINLKFKLQEWVDSLRENYIKCIHNNNGMLDSLFTNTENIPNNII